ncbi:MAG: SatD family protein [Eubacteriales bacterium]|nr:SatD family protein [Eubacteriales bacterium]
MSLNLFYDKYVAIIGDIVDSKRLKDRKATQQKYKDILSDVNLKYSEDIAAKFSITLGDEFQGLLKNRSNIMKIISEIEMAMSPVEMRFGIGIGDINTDINFDNSREIDGTAYHRARRMIEEVKGIRSQHAGRDASLMICSEDENEEIDELLNSILSVCTALKSKWTERQKEIIQAYLLNEENQYKAAKYLDIGQSSVSKALNNARFYSFKAALDNVNSFLGREGEGTSD